MTLEDLKKKNVWKYFLQLETIPRESRHEEGVRSWLLSWAEERGLEAFSDSAGNVIIRKAATPGWEKRTPVGLQGHMDMVCVKRPGSAHDFGRDPIDLVIDGDWLRARDTSLGGDDGIAVAIMLDVLSDEKLEHGPLECIITVCEEVGMDGAFGLKGEDVRSRVLLNLDSEDEGIAYIGCAGGCHAYGTMKIASETVPLDWKGYTLAVSGMLGGHSGSEIHKERANAIWTASRLLVQLPHLMLSSWEGGEKMNVIPGRCTVSFAVPGDSAASLRKAFDSLKADIAAEYKYNDPGATITLSETERPRTAAADRQSREFARAVFLARHGVFAMSQTIKGTVETSSNIAVVSMKDGAFTVRSSIRSAIDSRARLLARIEAKAFETAGMKTEITDGYPAWTPDPSSPLARLTAESYMEFTGKDLTVTAIHAGLECGVISSKVPGMQAISMGPQMQNIHSVDERLSIPSTERLDAFVKYLIGRIK